MAKGFIDGVYNYCDRWCERCPLTARCRVFALEKELKRTDDDNAAFWKVFDSLTQNSSREWVQDLEPDGGSDETDLNDWDEREHELDLTIRRNPMVKLSMDYGMLSREWFKANVDVQDPIPLDSLVRNPSADEIRRDDALEIVRWYALQIGVKLARAQRGIFRLDDELSDELDGEDSEVDDEVSQALVESANTDRDGSAKVALIGVERSLGAWTILRDHFPQQEEISNFQKTLARVRRFIDEQIPGARIFQRPGFEFEV